MDIKSVFLSIYFSMSMKYNLNIRLFKGDR